MTPAECRTREDIRREIDRLDRALIDLLVERFGYIRRMSEIKDDPAEADVDWRVKEVIDRVRALATERGLDGDLAAEIWTRLIDWNVGWERKAIAARKTGGQP